MLHRLLLSPTRRHLSTNSLYDSNTHLRLLTKSGHLSSAHHFFQKMPEKDQISYTTLISAYLAASNPLQSLSLFSSMLSSSPPLSPDPFVLSLAFKACSAAPDNGPALHAFTLKSGALDSSVFVSTALLSFYANAGDGAFNAMKVFDEIPNPNVVSWTAAVSALARAGRCRDAVRFFARMRGFGLEWDSYTFAATLKACADGRLIARGREIHGIVAKIGVESTPFVANTLATMYCKCGEVEVGLKLLWKTGLRDVVGWTSIIAAYHEMGREEEAVGAFVQMREDLSGNVNPNDYTYAAVISACGGLGKLDWGQQLHGQILHLGFGAAMSVVNALVTLYSRAGLLDCAKILFDETVKDIVSWSAIISGYCQDSQLGKAFSLFDEMRGEGWPPANEFTLSSLLSSCACLAVLDAGQQVHARALVAGLEREVMVTSALIDMYSNCGSIEDAARVFDGRNMDEIVSWTAMINGYAEHGLSSEAIQLFDKMQRTSKLKPDSVAFLGVLIACCHAGKVNLGLKYFEEMRTRYGIKPMREHYGCIVDLLGRAGKLGEAEKIIYEMPKDEVDAVVWTTLMRACAARGDDEGTARAAAKVKELEPWGAGAHVVMANFYAGKARWKEVAFERKSMKEKGVVKEAGWSSVGVGKDGAGVFVAGDRTHERMEDIYGMLDLADYGTRITGDDSGVEFANEEESVVVLNYS